MTRDDIKDKAYFDAYIEGEEKRIAKFKGVFDKASDGGKKNQCAGYIASFLKNKLTAQYSRGDSKEDIRATFCEYLKYAGKSKIDSYSDYVDILSLSIIFDVNADKLEGIRKETAKEDALVSCLYSYIAKKRIPENGSSKLAFPEVYSVFYASLVGGKDEVQTMLSFIKKGWYESCKDVYWYDSHKSKEDIYAGYWCWLGAAVLKTKGFSCKFFKYLPVF